MRNSPVGDALFTLISFLPLPSFQYFLWGIDPVRFASGAQTRKSGALVDESLGRWRPFFFQGRIRPVHLLFFPNPLPLFPPTYRSVTPRHGFPSSASSRLRRSFPLQCFQIFFSQQRTDHIFPNGLGPSPSEPSLSPLKSS